MSNIQYPIKEFKKNKFDIHERIFNFVTRVLNLTKNLPKTTQNIIFINQITRSSTSIGANDQEADGAMSRKDFFHCYTIVKKETKETNYWLKIISIINPSYSQSLESLIKEGKEIEAIVSAIVEKGR